MQRGKSKREKIKQIPREARDDCQGKERTEEPRALKPRATRLLKDWGNGIPPGADRSRSPARRRTAIGFSRLFGEGVVEVEGMLAVGDVDGHFAGEAGELAGAGIRDDGDGLLRCAPRQSATVLEDEAASAALERSGDALDGDVAGGAFDVGASGQHSSLAGGFEIAVDLFVDGHPAEGGVLEFAIGRLGSEFHFKGSGCMCRHGGSLLGWV